MQPKDASQAYPVGKGIDDNRQTHGRHGESNVLLSARKVVVDRKEHSLAHRQIVVARGWGPEWAQSLRPVMLPAYVRRVEPAWPALTSKGGPGFFPGERLASQAKEVHFD